MERWNGRDGLHPRAPRFRIQLPLHYRALGQTDWHSSETRDIRTSGALFDAEEALAPNTPLAITLILRWAPGANAPPEVSCLAHVVRSTPCEGSKNRYALAARFSDYDFPANGRQRQTQGAGGKGEMP
ncbi:MAG TPA: PilZ domain-containing protein [Terriglobales bacterium]|nr:PilZ domain-containing protein [Terriglobales bacterium]